MPEPEARLRWSATKENRVWVGLALTTGYGIVWGTLALINAGLAQGKGRSGLAWFFVSLFLGPITTFVIVLLDRKIT
jgi:hypothetical protein